MIIHIDGLGSISSVLIQLLFAQHTVIVALLCLSFGVFVMCSTVVLEERCLVSPCAARRHMITDAGLQVHISGFLCRRQDPSRVACCYY